MLTRRIVLAAALSLGVVGCTRQQMPSGPQAAQRETAVETSAVVESVDQTTREVRLRAADGRELTVVAGPAVRNLPQLRAGDLARLTYYEGVVARMAEPGAGGPATGAVVVGRAPEGGTPAGVVGATVAVVVEVVSYDAATGVVTLKTPDGAEESVRVDPAMRGFAAARRPGDRVAVEITRAVAISITRQEAGVAT